MKNKKKFTKKEAEKILKEEIKQFLLENPVLLKEWNPLKANYWGVGRPSSWGTNIGQWRRGLMDTDVDDRTINPGGVRWEGPAHLITGDENESAAEKEKRIGTRGSHQRAMQNELDTFNISMAAVGVLSMGIGTGASQALRVGAKVKVAALEAGATKATAELLKRTAQNAATVAAKKGLTKKATEELIKKAVTRVATREGVEEVVKKAAIETAKKQLPRHMGSLVGRGMEKMIELNPVHLVLKHGLVKLGMSATGASFAATAATLALEGWGVLEQFFCNAPKIKTKDGKGFRIYDNLFKHIDPFNWLLLAFERVIPGGNLGGWEGFLEKDKQFGGTLPDPDDEFKKHEGHGGMIMFLPQKDQDEYWALRGEVHERAAALAEMQNADEICKEAARAYGELLKASEEWHNFTTEKMANAVKAKEAYIKKRKKRALSGDPGPGGKIAIICVPGTNKGPKGEQPCIRLCKQDPFSDNLTMVDDWGDADGECPQMTLPQVQKKKTVGKVKIKPSQKKKV